MIIPFDSSSISDFGSVAAQLEGTEFVIISIFAGIYDHYKQKQKEVRGIKNPSTNRIFGLVFCMSSVAIWT